HADHDAHAVATHRVRGGGVAIGVGHFARVTGILEVFEDEFGVGGHRHSTVAGRDAPCYSPITARVSPSATRPPSATGISFTMPSPGDLISFSIFMASRVIRTSPRATVSPTFTLIERIFPAIWALTPPLTEARCAAVGPAPAWRFSRGAGPPLRRPSHSIVNGR